MRVTYSDYTALYRIIPHYTTLYRTILIGINCEEELEIESTVALCKIILSIPSHYSTTMAKGLRASTKKANKSLLRQNVFGPVEAARKERLSAKLIELASKSSPVIPTDVKMAEGGHEGKIKRFH